ncbi:LacI family DNA-binding transcriptional regulator [Bifidobacterium thermophilum]|uniref:LacI family DNA-binding transcriptional regulator n=1 Tax=Bifidobacterium thermophilum TaxID=33905 RepID=UPI0030AE949A
MAGAKTKVTITDVAKAAGVSNSAVSYALNGKPGVSEKTRKKVLEVADSMGWKPNSAAKALSVAKTHSIGVVMTAGSKLLGVEPYFMELFSGIGVELEEEDYSLLLRFARNETEALRAHRNWIAAGSVDAVLIFNVEIGDVRVELYQQHPEVPALVFSDPSVSGQLTTVSSNDADGARQIVKYLHELGHRHIARVAGPERFGHTYIRDRVFNEETSKYSMAYDCLHSDYSPEQGRECTERLLSLPSAPTAIVYDNDVMTVEGLHAAVTKGLHVPDDLSLMSWDDSYMCTATSPSLTALARDIPKLGAKIVPMLYAMINGQHVDNQLEPNYHLIPRGSTAAPRAEA